MVGEGGSMNMCPPSEGMPPSEERPENSAWYGWYSRRVLRLGAAVLTSVVSEPLACSITDAPVVVLVLRKSLNIVVLGVEDELSSVCMKVVVDEVVCAVVVTLKVLECFVWKCELRKKRGEDSHEEGWILYGLMANV